MEWQELDVHGRQVRIAGHAEDKAFPNLKGDLKGLAPLAALASAVLQPHSLTCDIGANLGLSTLVLTGQVPDGRVFAFEPEPKTNAYLKAPIAASGLDNVTIVQKALGAVVGQVFLHSGENFSAGSHIVTKRHVSSGALPTDAVQMTTLDAFLEAASAGRIDLIKIDTEGFEIDVLAGARSTLGQYRPVISLEMNSWCLIGFRNMNPRSFLESLLDNFPFVFWVTPSGKLRRIGKGVHMHYFLHEHLIRHRCVSDLVCCWHTDWLGGFGPGLET